MSTILKALEKVEQNERTGRASGVAEFGGSTPEPVPPTEPGAASQERRRLPWRGALIGATAVAVTLGLAWSWTPQPAEQEIASLEVLPAEPPPETVPAEPVRMASVPPVEADTVVIPEPPPIAVAAEIQPTAEEPLLREREAPAPPQVAIPKLKPKPRPKPAPPKVAVVPPPPVVHVVGTIWHPRTDRRSARVEVEGFSEPLELREGDAVGVLVVVEIQPSAVIFLHGGIRLRRNVGR